MITKANSSVSILLLSILLYEVVFTPSLVHLFLQSHYCYSVFFILISLFLLMVYICPSMYVEISTFKLKNCKYLVFDEADRLFEMGVSVCVLCFCFLVCLFVCLLACLFVCLFVCILVHTTPIQVAICVNYLLPSVYFHALIHSYLFGIMSFIYATNSLLSSSTK